MTFDTYADSIESSRPIELYKFNRGGAVTGYTTAEDAIISGGVEYIPLAIERDDLESVSESQRDEMKLRVSADVALFREYINNVPKDLDRFTLIQVERSDLPSPEEVILFEGTIQNVDFVDNARTAEVVVRGDLANANRPMPRFTYQGICNHVLYDDRCKVDRDSASFKVSGTVTSVPTVRTITVDTANSKADGFFTGGEITDVMSGDVRMILNHVGTSLQLLLPFTVTMTGRSVVMRAGCAHTIAVCKSKFDNVINYGGFAFSPLLNPFEVSLQ